MPLLSAADPCATLASPLRRRRLWPPASCSRSSRCSRSRRAGSSPAFRSFHPAGSGRRCKSRTRLRSVCRTRSRRDARGARYHFPDGVHMFSLGVAQGRGHARVLSLCVSVPEILGRSLFCFLEARRLRENCRCGRTLLGCGVWSERARKHFESEGDTLCARAAHQRRRYSASINTTTLHTNGVSLQGRTPCQSHTVQATQ